MVLFSLIEHYPNFNARLRACVRSLVGEEVEKRIDLGLAKDGSGVGGVYFFYLPRPDGVAHRGFCSCPLCTSSNQARPLKHPTRCTSICTTRIPQYPYNNCSPLLVHSPSSQPTNPLLLHIVVSFVSTFSCFDIFFPSFHMDGVCEKSLNKACTMYHYL